jgi:dsDNA-binding SOS-regulon protein
MDNLYGSLDLTVLGKLVRQHPELVRKVNFKDGEHQLINIDVFGKQQPDQYDNVATIKASCKKDQQKEGLSYYLANLKVSQYQNDNQQQKPARQKQEPQPSADSNDDLPF